MSAAGLRLGPTAAVDVEVRAVEALAALLATTGRDLAAAAGRCQAGLPPLLALVPLAPARATFAGVAVAEGSAALVAQALRHEALAAAAVGWVAGLLAADAERAAAAATLAAGLGLLDRAIVDVVGPSLAPLRAVTGAVLPVCPQLAPLGPLDGHLSRWVVRGVAAALDDGPGRATTVQRADVVALLQPAPTLGDWLARTQLVNLPHHGDVAVVTLVGKPPRYVVLLPGIHRILPGADVQDGQGAARALLAATSAYTRAVGRALDAAGVPVGAAVLLVGHSQGGIAAMDLAGDPGFNGPRVRVTHVVAAGSPITDKAVVAGSGTRVLSLENSHDLVPHLDGADGLGPHQPGRVVHVFDRDTGRVGANHGLEDTYAPAAGGPSPTGDPRLARAYADFSRDPAVGAFVGSAAPYLGVPVAAVATFVLTDR